MRLNRLRSGELVALIGAIGLLVVMFTDWYDGPGVAVFDRSAPEGGVQIVRDGVHTMGWSAVGWFAAGITAITIIVALFWLFATTTQDSTALPVSGDIVTILLGILTSIALLSRLVLQPGLGIGLGNADVDLRLTAYLGPLLAIVLTAGAWRALADERTEAPYSQPGDIELRPIPE